MLKSSVAIGFSLLLGLTASLAGCAADTEAPAAAAEDELRTAPVFANDVIYPSALTASKTHLYFGSNYFVASGDPELDQQYAYWDGALVRVPLAGGKKEKVADVGAIHTMRVAGDYLYVFSANRFYISRARIDGAKVGEFETVYQDRTTADSGEDIGGPIAGFEIVGNELVVARTDGQVLAYGLDGSKEREVAQIKAGNWADVTRQVLAVGTDLYVVTVENGDAKYPQSIYRVDVPKGGARKVMSLGATPSAVATDGASFYWSEGANVFGLDQGKVKSRTVAAGFGRATYLAATPGHLYVGDHTRGAVYDVAHPEAATPDAPKRIAPVAHIASVDVAAGRVFASVVDDSGARVHGSIRSIVTSQ